MPEYDPNGSVPCGEIAIRGPNVSPGYFRDPEKTCAILPLMKKALHLMHFNNHYAPSKTKVLKLSGMAGSIRVILADGIQMERFLSLIARRTYSSSLKASTSRT